MYNVMIIDDEMWSIIDIKKTIPFAELNMNLLSVFTDPISALIKILNEKPDIIITDIRMPNINGIELIKRIRENSLSSEIIIISGYSDFQVAKQAIAYGVSGYCLKPINAEELTSLLLLAKERLDLKSTDKTTALRVIKEESMDAFDKMVQYIEKNYNHKLVLNDLAEKFFLNPNYCSTLFSKRKNTSFSKYLLSMRLNAAKTFLENSNYNFNEIAQKVGFQDYFYFSKVFKKETGLSPRGYKKQMQKGRSSKNNIREKV